MTELMEPETAPAASTLTATIQDLVQETPESLVAALKARGHNADELEEYSRGALTVTRLLEGRPQEAQAMVTPVVEEFPRAIYLGIQAWALAEDRRIDEAKAIVSRLREPEAFAGVPRDHHLPVTLCVLSRVCFLLEDAAVAEELYDVLIPFRSTTVNGQTIWWGPATHDLGLLATLLGHYDEAEQHFADAVERQDRMGARGTVVHTRLAWATMLLRRNASGDALRAHTLLREAKAGAREVNIPRVEARVDTMLGTQ